MGAFFVFLWLNIALLGSIGLRLSTRAASSVQGQCAGEPVGSIAKPTSEDSGVTSLTECAQFAAMLSASQPGLQFVSFRLDSLECLWYKDCACAAKDVCEGGKTWQSGSISELNNAKLSVTLGPDGEPVVTHTHAKTTTWEEILALKRRVAEDAEQRHADKGKLLALVIVSSLLGACLLVVAGGEYYKSRFGDSE